MKLHTFKQAEQFLALHIPKSSAQIFPGELGLKRAKYFLRLLGQPQEKLKIIHVAGTSGKGSTCYLISSLLAGQGFKVGLHQSPHLTDVRERFQIYTERSRSINNQIISKKEFIFYLNKIIPMIDAPLTYFEILVGLAYLIFYEKKVDYAVMETGLGGWYDATNVVERPDKLSVLTKIGLDHTNILGKTIEKIALQKAMIINKNSQAISIDQDTEVEKVIEGVVKEKNAKVFFVSSPRRKGSMHLDSRSSSLSDINLRVDDLRGNDSIERMTQNLALIGDYQKENAGLALTIINFLSKRDGFLVDREKIKKVFETASFPGRFDVKKIAGKTVVFDGAHNPQKMKAFISSLIKKYPDKKFNFLLAFKKGKDYQGMLKIIIPWVNSIILTSFFTENQDMINASENPNKIGLTLSEIEGFNNFEINPSLKKAWVEIIKKKEPIVVTGSLYLIGEVYKLIKNN